MVSLAIKYFEKYSNRQNIETCIIINQTNRFWIKIRNKLATKFSPYTSDTRNTFWIWYAKLHQFLNLHITNTSTTLHFYVGRHANNTQKGFGGPDLSWVSTNIKLSLCGRDVLLTTHPLLVPRSWKCRAIPLTRPVTGSLYLSFLLNFHCGPGSSVGIATDYGLDGPGSNPGGDENFRPSRPALESTQPPVKWVPGLCRE